MFLIKIECRHFLAVLFVQFSVYHFIDLLTCDVLSYCFWFDVNFFFPFSLPLFMFWLSSFCYFIFDINAKLISHFYKYYIWAITTTATWTRSQWKCDYDFDVIKYYFVFSFCFVSVPMKIYYIIFFYIYAMENWLNKSEKSYEILRPIISFA